MPDAITDRPTRADRLEVTEVDDGLVVYHDSPERVHHLNNTAAYVFELSSGDRTIEAIAAEMGTAFGLKEAPLEAVIACVEHLRANGLLR
jgi:hypothetical protein